MRFCLFRDSVHTSLLYVRLKREKVEKDIEIKKWQVKVETQKRVYEARQFIDQLNMDDEEAQLEMETTGLKKIATILKKEEDELREVSSANLLSKLEGRDVPYRIRNEVKPGIRRWQMLYADACHRKKLDDKGTYRSSSPSPRYSEKIIDSPPVIGELRDTMANVPHGSWSYDFRCFSPPSFSPGAHEEAAFQPGKVVSMVNFSPLSRSSNIPNKTMPSGFQKFRTNPLTVGGPRNSRTRLGGKQNPATSYGAVRKQTRSLSPSLPVQHNWSMLATGQMQTVNINEDRSYREMGDANAEDNIVTTISGIHTPLPAVKTYRLREYRALGLDIFFLI